MPILKCHAVEYCSLLDEEIFFYALKRISAVQKIEGVGSDLFITVRSKPSQQGLRELLGLFFRYQIDMTQLAVFETKQNADWFRAPGAYWAKLVFPKKRINEE
jgi:hypothetical protein